MAMLNNQRVFSPGDFPPRIFTSANRTYFEWTRRAEDINWGLPWIEEWSEDFGSFQMMHQTVEKKPRNSGIRELLHETTGDILLSNWIWNVFFLWHSNGGSCWVRRVSQWIDVVTSKMASMLGPIWGIFHITYWSIGCSCDWILDQLGRVDEGGRILLYLHVFTIISGSNPHFASAPSFLAKSLCFWWRYSLRLYPKKLPRPSCFGRPFAKRASENGETSKSREWTWYESYESYEHVFLSKKQSLRFIISEMFAGDPITFCDRWGAHFFVAVSLKHLRVA